MGRINVEAEKANIFYRRDAKTQSENVRKKELKRVFFSAPPR
jgi:hypothetical protein